LSRNAIRRHVATGRLFRIHRGVYAVGHDGLSERGRWKAATQACGERSVLSHTSAAALWGLIDFTDADPHVTVPTRSGRPQRDGITLHRSATPLGAVTGKDNIPVTQPQRTLVDIRTLVDPGRFRHAIREAEIKKLPIETAALIADRATSGLELEFLAFCHRHRLPAPEVNARIGRYRVDFLWRCAGFAVETDSERYHGGTLAQLDDIERDRYLTNHGLEVARVTADDLSSPRRLAARIRARVG
jgi:Transcriptional regulator, AbiEi antitoxin